MIVYKQTDKVSADDLSKIITLLTKNFPGDLEALKQRFTDEFSQDTDLEWLIAYHNNCIIGVLLLRPKIMNFLSAKLSVCGMSYMAIDAEFQRHEVAENLKKMVLETGDKYDLSLGFARKKMDGYWSPYNFVGISDFSETKIKTLDINLYDPEFSVQIEDAEIADLEAIEKIYTQNNYNLIGNFHRSLNEFEFAISTPNHRGCFKRFICAEVFCGYMIIQDEKVVEIRIKKGFYENCAFALKKYFQHKSQKIISFKTHLNDPFIRYISQFSHTTEMRYAYEGGHIIRISDLESFFDKIAPVLAKRLSNFNFSDFEIENNLIHIHFTKGVLDIDIKDKLASKELTKLAFGIVSSHEEIWHLIFGNLHTQFPTFDQF
tara:strand:+ start:5673 stop:6797 length:1125 start_codon:yes stop_codon:yes gene_type:complete